jgi:2-desacetyl-2-hydroxyethyl bacteriochlorophyllide A dehydrogenase
MKALIYQGPHQMAWETWPDPHPGPEQALIAVRAVGICGSDVHGYTGATGRRIAPMVMGHEAVGDVVAVGEGVPASWQGKRVVIRPNILCGKCDHCRSGRANICQNRSMIGVQQQGAMAEFVAAPVENLLPLSDGMDSDAATLVEPLAVGVRAVHQAGDVLDKIILVAGCGPIGLLTMIAARQSGVRKVVMTDVVAKRRETALMMGADIVFDPSRQGWQEELFSTVGSNGVDIAFDAVGLPATFEQALFSLGWSGTLVALGGWQTATLDLRRLVGREIQVVGSFNYLPEEFDLALRWLESGIFDPALLITDRYPLSEGARVFANLAISPSDSLKVVLTPSG